MLKNTEFTNKLRSSGLRPTKQRLKICEVLFNRDHTFHFTINDLAKNISKELNERISLATVYNTVHAFKKKGYLKEISINSDKSYFDTNTKNHHHFFDEDTNELIDCDDGIIETPGRIIIMTTNKPELLDEALVRPGRIDIRINFSKSTEEDVKNILNHYWKDEKDIWDKIGCLKELDKKFTPAEIVDTCRKSNCISESIKNLNLIVNEN